MIDALRNVALAFAALATAAPALAQQDWPTKPVKIVVPFAAGGAVVKSPAVFLLVRESTVVPDRSCHGKVE